MSGLSTDSVTKVVATPDQTKDSMQPAVCVGAIDKAKTKGESLPVAQQSQNFFPDNPEEKKEKVQSLQELMADGDISNSGLTEQQQMQEFLRKYNFKNLGEAQQKIAQIREERKQLRIKLDQFQKNFEQVHNRKIRYTKDIVSVQTEFARYKSLKGEASLIEKFMKTLPK